MPGRAAFVLASEAVVSIDQDLTIVEINPAFGRLMGWPEGQAAGRRCFEVLRCRDTRKELLCGTPRCPAHQAFTAEAELPLSELAWTTRDGKVCELSASISVERGPRPTHAVLVARDVTALNAANRMRPNFISMVFHDLRTPRNPYHGF